jgi:amino acid transporter
VLTCIELSGAAADHRGRQLRGGRRPRRAGPAGGDQHRRDRGVPGHHGGHLAGVLRDGRLSIIFTSVIAIILVITVDITLLGGTTALLLLGVFTIVNIAVLVLRRDQVEHAHFRAPSWTPWAGIVLCGFLATPLSGRSPREFLIAGILLAVGAVLWVINRLFVGRVEVDATRLGKS